MVITFYRVMLLWIRYHLIQIRSQLQIQGQKSWRKLLDLIYRTETWRAMV